MKWKYEKKTDVRAYEDEFKSEYTQIITDFYFWLFLNFVFEYWISNKFSARTRKPKPQKNSSNILPTLILGSKLSHESIALSMLLFLVEKYIKLANLSHNW